MSTDVCLRPLATPDDVDLYDLLTCTTPSTGGAPGGRRFVTPIPPIRRSSYQRINRRARVQVGASMTYVIDPAGRLAEEDLLLDLL